MSEPAKVRLVRCPKCENLLPELTDFSLYKCGGCDAILRGALSENSEEERNDGFSGRLSEKSKNIEVSEKNRINIGEVSEDDVKSNCSSNRSERRRLLQNRTENYGTSQLIRADKWVVEDSLEADDDINRISRSKMDKNFEDVMPQIGNGKGFQRSGEQLDWRFRGRESEMEDFRRAQRIDADGTQYSASKYLEDGPSNYQLQGSYGSREPLKNRNELDGSDDVENLGENRAELLRKLDELKDKLSRSWEGVDKPKDKVPLDRRMFPPDPYGYSEKWYPEDYVATNRSSLPYSFPDHHAARPSYANHYYETSPFMDRHAMVGRGFYPAMHTSAHLQEFEDPLRPQLFRRGPYQAPAPFQQKPPHAYFSGMHADGNMVPRESYESYASNVNHHHPSCSCFHCYNKYQVSRQVPPNTYGIHQFSDVTNDPAFYRHDYQNASGARDYGAKFNALASFKSSSSVSHARWPSDMQSEASGFGRNRPSRVLLTTAGRQCQPVAGGAPFFACQNCHELLQLPRKVSLNRNLKKMRCGACSTLILLAVDSKRLIVSVHAEANPNHKKFNVLHQSDRVKEASSQTRAHTNRASRDISSDAYDNTGYNFQSMDRELGSVSTGPGSSLKAADIRSPHSTFSSSSEKEDNLDTLTAMRKNLNSPKLPVKGKLSPPPAGSPLQDYFDYSNKYNLANRFGDGNRSGRSEREKSTNKTISRQDSVKDASATEIEISSNEYSHTGTSLDSGEASRGDQMRANKAAESFMAGITKKSFGDSNRSNDDTVQEKANVTVNGNLISDRLIKRAEKLAGPIHPGHYWYDFRAGFWGVIGGPCLGVIPPFIEEFNYPIPANCTGGTTGIFVNGRELHQKDLNLLGSRGLPTDRGRSFIVEISGRVIDEDTGEELESLGKLAPTVERLKHGFGMKCPKAVVIN